MVKKREKVVEGKDDTERKVTVDFSPFKNVGFHGERVKCTVVYRIKAEPKA